MLLMCCCLLIMKDSGVQADISKYAKGFKRGCDNSMQAPGIRQKRRTNSVSLFELLSNNKTASKRSTVATVAPGPTQLQPFTYMQQQAAAPAAATSTGCPQTAVAIADIKLPPSKHREVQVNPPLRQQQQHYLAGATAPPALTQTSNLQRTSWMSCKQSSGDKAAQPQSNMQACPLCGVVLPISQLQQHVDEELLELEEQEQQQDQKRQGTATLQSQHDCWQQQQGHTGQHPQWQKQEQLWEQKHDVVLLLDERVEGPLPNQQQERQGEHQIQLRKPSDQLLQQLQWQECDQWQPQTRLQVQQQQLQWLSKDQRQGQQQLFRRQGGEWGNSHHHQQQQYRHQHQPQRLLRQTTKPPPAPPREHQHVGASHPKHTAGCSKGTSSVQGLCLAPSRARGPNDDTPASMLGSFDHWGDSASNWMDDSMIGLEGAPRSEAECWEALGSCAFGPRHLG